MVCQSCRVIRWTTNYSTPLFAPMTGYQVLWSTSLPKYSPPGTLSYLHSEYSPREPSKDCTPSFVLEILQRVKVGWTIGCWNSQHSGVKWAAAAAFCNPCLSFEASIEYRWKIGFLSLKQKRSTYLDWENFNKLSSAATFFLHNKEAIQPQLFAFSQRKTYS